jgi:hypothetical protein
MIKTILRGLVNDDKNLLCINIILLLFEPVDVSNGKNKSWTMSFLEKELDTKQNHNFLGARKFRCL